MKITQAIGKICKTDENLPYYAAGVMKKMKNRHILSTIRPLSISGKLVTLCPFIKV